MLKALCKDRRLVAVAACAMVVAVVAAVVAWKAGVRADTLKEWVAGVQAFLEARPVMIFVAIAVLPGLPFPVSVLLILAGGVYGRSLGIPLACGVTLAAMVINATWTYWVACKPARALIQRLVSKSIPELPVLPGDEHVRMTLIVRLTPGIPLFVQNYLLGLARVPFGIYMLVSVPTLAFWTCGFVISSGALFQGNSGLAIAGVALLVVATLVTRMLRRKFAPRAES